ncbi:MAG: hypothetical protein ACI4VW_00675 [Acutalibacteraceae bacterium]
MTEILKGSVYTSSCTENQPDWYWINGLHDACIVDVEYFEFSFDFNKFGGNKNSHDRNLMQLKINASGALYDQDIKEIKLFNFKIVTNNTELKGRKSCGGLQIG